MNDTTTTTDKAPLLAADMTLRDRFAVESLRGLLVHPLYRNLSDETMALYAYQQVDAMLAAREGQPHA